VRILVTGASGFVGSKLVKRLVEDGFDILAVDQNSLPIELINLEKQGRLCFFKGDIVNYSFLSEAITRFGKVDYICHVAAKIPSKANDEIGECLRVNIKGTQNILEIARVGKVKGMVLSSTCDLYGRQNNFPISEEAEVLIRNFYSLSKYCAELYAKEYFNKFGVKTVVLRYAGIYGPGKNSGAVNNFIASALSNEPPKIDNDGIKTKDVIHVYDIVNANVLAIKKVDEIGFDTINISSNQEVSLRDLAGMFIRLVGRDIAPICGAKATNERLVFDNRKAKKILNFGPMLIEEGLKQFIAFKRSEHAEKNT